MRAVPRQTGRIPSPVQGAQVLHKRPPRHRTSGHAAARRHMPLADCQRAQVVRSSPSILARAPDDAVHDCTGPGAARCDRPYCRTMLIFAFLPVTAPKPSVYAEGNSSGG
jgi:hypothetical protein